MAQIEQVGCFKIGSKVQVGNGKQVRTIIRFGADANGVTWAILATADGKGTNYKVRDLSLAGANG